ncbi:hypothetical protein DVZ84_31905 [Streptomyces parvulus]|uniref:Uncharacterized protein n=2 Tax=Streptomyces parvulus TaxID=146923 RepID=A0A369UXY0_9ACTN|nr:hypothetical protein DVZ84_31905 [Streptomyces parvulus]
MDELPEEVPDNHDTRRAAIGVILLISIFTTLLAELAVATVGAGLAVTAISGLGVFSGSLGIGYHIIKKLGYAR